MHIYMYVHDKTMCAEKKIHVVVQQQQKKEKGMVRIIW